jgi:hypothetical protein
MATKIGKVVAVIVDIELRTPLQLSGLRGEPTPFFIIYNAHENP